MPGTEAGAAERARLRHRALYSVNKLDFFIEGHLPDHKVGSLVGR